jgi:hypothetical protein
MDYCVRSHAELNALRFLVSRASGLSDPNASKGDFEALLDELSDYVWTNLEHRVVYDCLRTAFRAHMAPLRQEMASVATRLGHPDVDWHSYFEQPTESADIAHFTRGLKRNRP